MGLNLIEVAGNICQDIDRFSQCFVLHTSVKFSTARTEHPHLGITKADTEIARISA